MKTITRYIYFTLLFYSLSSCSFDLNLEFHDSKSEIVVNALFSNRDTAFLYLSRSKSIIKSLKYDTLIPDANVFCIVNQKDTIRFKKAPHIDKVKYSSNVIPSPGKLYELFVIIEEYDTIKSKMLMPTAVDIDSLYYYITPNNHSTMMDINLFVEFLDPNIANFYFYSFKAYQGVFTRKFDVGSPPIYYEMDYSQEITNNMYWWVDDAIAGEFNKYTAPQLYVFKDDSFAGARGKVGINLMGEQQYVGSDYDSIMLIPQLYALTSDFYYYCESLNKQEQAKAINLNDPINTYSNIDNGVGVFAGFTISEDTLYIGYNEMKGKEVMNSRINISNK